MRSSSHMVLRRLTVPATRAPSSCVLASRPVALTHTLRWASAAAATPSSSSAPAGKTPAVRCLDTSPASPLASVFQPMTHDSDADGTPSHLVLHTAFKDVPSAAKESVSSFQVLSNEALDQLIAEALANAPAEGSVEESRDGKSDDAPKHMKRAKPTAKETADAEEAIANAVCTVSPGQHHNHLTRELQRLVRDIDAELAPLLAIKRPIDHYAYKRYYPLLKYGCFAVLATQFVVYFNWIFFVFDWNLVEPTTYFIAYTGVFCSLVYHYFRCDVTSSEEFTWRNLFVYLAGKKAQRLYAKKGLDVQAYNNLIASKKVALAELAKYKP